MRMWMQWCALFFLRFRRRENSTETLKKYQKRQLQIKGGWLGCIVRKTICWGNRCAFKRSKGDLGEL